MKYEIGLFVHFNTLLINKIYLIQLKRKISNSVKILLYEVCQKTLPWPTRDTTRSHVCTKVCRRSGLTCRSSTWSVWTRSCTTAWTGTNKTCTCYSIGALFFSPSTSTLNAWAWARPSHSWARAWAAAGISNK